MIHGPSIKTKPTKFWIGKKRLAKRLLGRQAELKWALELNPGDYVAVCSGGNRQVERLEYYWVNEGEFRRCKPNKTWVLLEIVILDTKGGTHRVPSCAGPKESNEHIEGYYRSLIKSIKDGTNSWYKELTPRYKLMDEMLSRGETIVSSYGELLPIFDDTDCE